MIKIKREREEQERRARKQKRIRTGERTKMKTIEKANARNRTVQHAAKEQERMHTFQPHKGSLSSAFI